MTNASKRSRTRGLQLREVDLSVGLPAASSALSVSGVGYAYGSRRVLDNVSFDIQAGEFTVLLGLNGAGKSTLFALITRLYDTREGSIRVHGYNIAEQPGEALRRLGVVFQSRTLDLDLSILQNLLYHGALHGIGRNSAKTRAVELLQQLDLEGRIKDKVRNLSGGQMRRVEIARALMHNPQLLLLDEATVGLDIRARADIISHMRGLVERESVGVLWATHLIDEVGADDSVVVLHHGKVLAAGKVSQVLEQVGSKDIGAAFTSLTESQHTSGKSEAAA